MVASATVSTMIMPVAAERPPMKAMSAISGCCCFIGMVSTKVSASTPPCGNVNSPANAIGSTKMLMSSRYSGNSHIAFLRWRSSTFSTTITWNWRGRTTIAPMASTVSVIQLVCCATPLMVNSRLSAPEASARAKMSPRPP